MNMFVNELKPKIGDVFVLLGIIMIAVSVVFCFRTKGDTVEVCQNGTVLYEIRLSDPANEGKEFLVEGKYTNRLLVKQGKIFVADADCPDRFCKHSAPLGQNGGVICCIPNGMMIRHVKHNGLDVIVQ